jgi:diguanylate cyclase (GGDEF)-like protein
MDGQRTLAHRLCVSVLAAAALQSRLTPSAMTLWLFALVASELFTWLGTRGITHASPGTLLQRAAFLLHVGFSTFLWSLVSVWLWFSHVVGLQVVGAIIVCAQLIHAQTFTYRSTAIFAVSAGIPAGVIAVLTLGFSGLSGLDLGTAMAGLVLTFGYVVAGTRANIANARSIAGAQADLERLAYTDALTALANRRRFAEKLQQLIAYSQKHRTAFALMLVDLDGFKAINDAFGHDVGDDVLVSVADSLRHVKFDSDHVARLGGDEFALLLPDMASDAHFAELFDEIATKLAKQDRLAGRDLKITLSAGAAVYPDHAQAASGLMKAADSALYDAKTGGRNTWRAYRPPMAAEKSNFPQETSCSAPSGMQGHSGATVAKGANRVPLLLQ